MTEREDFLSRWARRKREAAAHATAAETKPDSPAPEKDEAKPANRPAPTETSGNDIRGEPLFDLSTLPPIESISAGTDIRIFMQPGVPAALTRAALRRAWSADPAIRDYIGLSENAWDFTAPDSMTGFGPLDPAEVPRLLGQIFGETQTADAPPAASQQIASLSETTGADPQPSDTSGASATGSDGAPGQRGAAPSPELVHRENSLEVKSDDNRRESEQDNPVGRPRRGHGGALPS